ncbi:hypothetical protein [Haladaptatus sp. DJG-WS-42]|uniref:hypothetical protein n=1 Tax=Haladaptatus sp. DJG-WS-42 TaxID=3120516 RepID=UPI0030CD5562
MNRRHYLTAVGIGLGTISGCLGPINSAETLPREFEEATPISVPGKSTNTTTTAEPTTDRQSMDLSKHEPTFYHELLDSDVHVTGLEHTDGTVLLRYVPENTSVEDDSLDTGPIGAAFAASINERWDVDRLEVTAVTAADEPLARFYILARWASNYSSLESEPNQYWRRIQATVTVVE